MALLFAKKIIVLAKYIDFANIFLKKLIKRLAKQTGINKYINKLVEDKQPFYRPIYSLNLIKLKTLKTYIENNLVNSFI